MNYKFRNDLIESNKEFGNIFKELFSNGEIKEFSTELKSIINRDRTVMKIDNEPLAFKDLFYQGLTEGRCALCSSQMVLLLDKFGIYSEAVRCVNNYFKGTTGSTYGGHWYIEANYKGKVVCIDTSLMIMGSVEAFKKLGFVIEKKYDIDTLFKENPELIDYYESMSFSNH